METEKTAKHFNDLLVVKVGTNTLTTRDSLNRLALDRQSFNRIGHQISQLADKGAALAVVSSGAIAAGYAYSREERTHETRQDIIEKQRMACLGQTILMNYWQQALRPKLVGQLLFTKRELETTEGAELSAVTIRLFEHGDIAIANENDALSHEEITFGDNDTLAARFAVLLHKSGIFTRTRLVILSDIDGVYENAHDQHSVIPIIDDIDAYTHVAGDTNSINGTGGMISKFNAAKIAAQNGIETYIANGRAQNVIKRVLAGEIGTQFTTSSRHDAGTLTK